METTASSPEKRIVTELDFDAKTAKRVGWEAWEFTVIDPHLVEVVNASYGFEKADHTYTIGIEERDGVPIPTECSCPADLHREPDCKHKVAVATVGGLVVLNAAVNAKNDTTPLSEPDTDGVTTVADRLQPDGGTATVPDDSDVCANGNDHCDGPDGDGLPCFDCYEVDE